MDSSGYVEIEYVREFAGGLTNADAHFCQRGGAAAGRWLARGCVSVGLATVHWLRRPKVGARGRDEDVLPCRGRWEEARARRVRVVVGWR